MALCARRKDVYRKFVPCSALALLLRTRRVCLVRLLLPIFSIYIVSRYCCMVIIARIHPDLCIHGLNKRELRLSNACTYQRTRRYMTAKAMREAAAGINETGKQGKGYGMKHARKIGEEAKQQWMDERGLAGSNKLAYNTVSTML